MESWLKIGDNPLAERGEKQRNYNQIHIGLSNMACWR